VPSLAGTAVIPRPIPGTAPQPGDFPAGCRFAPRCEAADRECSQVPGLIGEDGHQVACWHPVRNH
jgi:oligopeptide/dipeptide ABC transporter ATP-binding protein